MVILSRKRPFRPDQALRLLGLFFLVLTLSACSTAQKAQQAFEDKVVGPGGRSHLDLAGSPTVYFDTQIQLADMQVMIHPNKNLEKVPTALFVPFGLTQDMADALPVSQGTSYQLWQQLLQRGSFSVLELANMRPPYRVDMALPLAENMGADMLVGGYITYYFDGGRTRDSKVSIQMDVYEVSSGNLLWSMARTGVMPAHTYRDFVLFEVHSRMPEDPMGALVRALGGDFAHLLHMWTSPDSYKSQPGGAKNYYESAFGSF